MMPPVPVRNPDRLPSTDPLYEERRKNLAMLLAEIDTVPPPEGTTPLEPIEVVDPNAEPEVLSNQDLAIALAGRFGRNIIPGGSRLAANLFAADGQDPMSLLQQYNDQDDAVFSQAPVASVMSDMAGMAVPLGAAASGMRRYVDTARRYPKFAAGMSHPYGMAATGAAYGVTDEAYDRPDDGNLGTAALMGGASGFAGSLVPPLANLAGSAIRRKVSPNYWEREDDLWDQIEKINQQRRHDEYLAIARAADPPAGQQTRAPTAQSPLSSGQQSVPGSQGAAQLSPPQAQQSLPGHPASAGQLQSGPLLTPPQVQPSVPGSAPAVPVQAQSSPTPQGSPVGSAPPPQPVVTPKTGASPIPQGVRYSKGHSEAVKGRIGPMLQQLVTHGDVKRLTPDQKNTIADGIIGIIRDAGLPVPARENIQRRLAKSVNTLRQLQRAGADITSPNVIAQAFGRAGTLAAPFAIGGPLIPDFLGVEQE